MKKLSILFGEATLLLAVNVPQVLAQGGETLDLNKGTFVATPPVGASQIVRFALNLLIVIGLVMSLVFLLIGAIRWVMSGGDKAGVEAARNTIVASVVGLVIIILSWVIFNLVLRLFGIPGIGGINLPTLQAPG